MAVHRPRRNSLRRFGKRMRATQAASRGESQASSAGASAMPCDSQERLTASDCRREAPPGVAGMRRTRHSHGGRIGHQNSAHERPRPVARGRPGPLPPPPRHPRRRRRGRRRVRGRLRLGTDAPRPRRPRAPPRRGQRAQRGERHDDGHRPAHDAHALLGRQRHAARGAALGAGDPRLRLHRRPDRRPDRRLVRAAARADVRAAHGGGRRLRPLLLRRLRARGPRRDLRRPRPRRAARLGRRLGAGPGAGPGRAVGRRARPSS